MTVLSLFVKLGLVSTVASAVHQQATNSMGLPRHKHPLIVGGSLSSAGSHMHTVYLEMESPQDSSQCVGALISPQWVVTAAHCTEGFTARHLTVIYGNRDYRKGTRNPVKQIINHEKYVTNGDFDVALLRLSNPITSIAPLKLFDGELEPNSLVLSLGWGVVNERLGTSSDLLKQVELNTGSAKTCKANGDGDTTMYVCAGGNEAGEDSCSGDSGGPLLFQPTGRGDYISVGILSHAFGSCGSRGTWAFYTKTSRFLTWISQKTGVPVSTLKYSGAVTVKPAPSPAVAATTSSASGYGGDSYGSGDYGYDGGDYGSNGNNGWDQGNYGGDYGSSGNNGWGQGSYGDGYGQGSYGGDGYSYGTSGNGNYGGGNYGGGNYGGGNYGGGSYGGSYGGGYGGGSYGGGNNGGNYGDGNYFGSSWGSDDGYGYGNNGGSNGYYTYDEGNWGGSTMATTGSSSSCAGLTDLDTTRCTSNKKYCEAGSSFYTWMLANCKKTCCSYGSGTKAPAPAPAPASAPSSTSSDKCSSERDASTFCKSYLDHCKAGMTYTAWMKNNCAKSCCDTDSTSTATASLASNVCSEKDTSTFCYAYVNHCNAGEQYHSWMQVNCKATCCAANSGCSGKADASTLCSSYSDHCKAGSKYYAWAMQNCDSTCCKQ